MEENLSPLNKQSIEIYVLSGGVGASGEQLARTVAAQYRYSEIQIEVFSKISAKRQIGRILKKAAETGAVIVHSFVDPNLHRKTIKTSKKLGLVAIDLVGPLIGVLSEKLDQVPVGTPGLYRQLYKSYFDRIAAMDYSLDHDDGKKYDGWREAEIVLVGASRVGKTPVSIYLAVLGWKVANIPIIAGVPPNRELFKLDMRRVVGLTIAPSELVEHREHRQRRLGLISRASEYVDPVKVFEETETIEHLLKRRGIPVIDVTGKPIETSADEVVRLIRRKLRI